MKNNFLIYMLLNIFLFSQDINKTIELDNYVNKKQFEKENIELNKFSINYDLLEDVIDSKRYIVGPGDIFSFNMLSADGIVNKSLIVNPTGEVLIPAIGNINVNNQTLYDAINLINKKCLLKYPNSNIHVALIKIRRFKIQVKGINDIVSYVEASQIMRVSEIMSKIYSDFNNNHKIKISERNIKIMC